MKLDSDAKSGLLWFGFIALMVAWAWAARRGA
jgi:hypothetical protein